MTYKRNVSSSQQGSHTHSGSIQVPIQRRMDKCRPRLFCHTTCLKQIKNPTQDVWKNVVQVARSGSRSGSHLGSRSGSHSGSHSGLHSDSHSGAHSGSHSDSHSGSHSGSNSGFSFQVPIQAPFGLPIQVPIQVHSRLFSRGLVTTLLGCFAGIV